MKIQPWDEHFIRSIFISAALALALAGCGGGGGGTDTGTVTGTTSYTVGVTVTGLVGSVVLRNNGGDDLTVTKGTFTFATKLVNGSTYKVTVLSQPTSTIQTCSVSSGAGTISGSNVSVLVVCSATTYTVSVSVSGLNGTAVLQINDGDNLSVTNGTFNFATPVAENSPYNVTLLSLQFPNQTCTGGSGTLTTNVTVPVTCAKNTTPRFAYVANNGSDTVSAYTIDHSGTATSGTLTSVGAPVATGSRPYSVTVDPFGKFAYVANNYSNDISAYTITSTGVLTPISCTGTCSATIPANFAAGSFPTSVTVDPTGKFAYVANNGSDDVSAYTITSTGALTQIPCVGVAGCNGNNFLAGAGSYSVTIDPSGQFAYVANFVDNTVSQYTIAADGSLTAMSTATVAAGYGPGSVTVDPSGKFAYVANYFSDDVSAYKIESTGALTPISCTGTCSATIPANFAAGTGPFSITVDPSGKFVYVANEGDGINPGTVSAYTIDSSGALISIGAPVTTGINPFSITTTIH